MPESRPEATALKAIAEGVHHWEVYSEEIRAYLGCYAVSEEAADAVIDPALGTDPEPVLEAIARLGAPEAILLTTSTHWRQSAEVAQRFSCPIFAHEKAVARLEIPELLPYRDGDVLPGGLGALEIAGTYPGECALHRAGPGGGQLFIGDAVLNMEETGLILLPEEYGGNHGDLKRSLARLLDLPFEQLFPGHGRPILEGARAALRGLLAG